MFGVLTAIGNIVSGNSTLGVIARDAKYLQEPDVEAVDVTCDLERLDWQLEEFDVNAHEARVETSEPRWFVALVDAGEWKKSVDALDIKNVYPIDFPEDYDNVLICPPVEHDFDDTPNLLVRTERYEFVRGAANGRLCVLSDFDRQHPGSMWKSAVNTIAVLLSAQHYVEESRIERGGGGWRFIGQLSKATDILVTSSFKTTTECDMDVVVFCNKTLQKDYARVSKIFARPLRDHTDVNFQTAKKDDDDFVDHAALAALRKVE